MDLHKKNGGRTCICNAAVYDAWPPGGTRGRVRDRRKNEGPDLLKVCTCKK